MTGRLVLLTAFLVGAVPVAYAQAHPCDAAPTPNPSVFNPYRVGFCSDLKDLDGTPILPADAQIRITIDSTAQALRPMPTPIGTPNAAGLNYYEVPGMISVKGAHSVTVALVTAEGEGVSLPFAFAVRGKAPKPPVPRVVQ